ncbi:MAG TPA: TetR family transcriptional regulator [Actinobacteria bacterium]|nr:TetR family transcriptional regulator [Actinomycetota bacterium]
MNGTPSDVETRSDGRSDHKPRTRQALIDASLKLFAAKGYDATSIDEIAALVGISPRTFFRYFETKDQVLFFGGDAFNDSVVRRLPGQPVQLDDLGALEATLISLTPMVTPLKARIRLFYQALDGTRTLIGQQELAMRKHDAAVASALADRRALARPDDRCHMAAALASVAVQQAYVTWLGSRRALPEILEENFALLRSVSVT